ncbi:AAA family ATPase [Paenibacillus rhizolycopersici]|uniref:AAA family ATPase n=1 Tax=Paenibacillus rhizolycopersici TaxID=2780073 RepID=UPI003D26C596
MLILKSYEINNFKNIKNWGPIGDKKLTIISGVNSGGKSSLIQGLLLLKDIVTSKNEVQIDFTGLNAQLGDFEDVLNKKNGADTIDLSLELIFKKSDKYNDFFIDLLNSLRGPLYFLEKENLNKLNGLNEISISLSFSFGLIKKDSYQKGKLGVVRFRVDYQYGQQTLFMEIQQKNYSYSVSSNRLEMVFQQNFINFFFDQNRNEEDVFSNPSESLKKFSSSIDEKLKENLSISFDNHLYPVFIYPSNLGKKKKHESLFISDLFNTKINKILEYLADGIYYIGPLREDPKLSYYIRAINKDDIGVKGENAPKVFFLRQDRTYLFSDPPLENGPLLLEQSKRTLKSHVNRWASYILAGNISYRVEKYSSENFGLFNMIDSHRRRMTNVGVGTSQIFPIIVEGIRRKFGLFILEQPEIHLHPAAQARLADFLISVALNNNLKIIVETHSEHLINRLVRRNIRRELDMCDTSILFVNDGRLMNINRDDIGMINEWPQGFLDTGLHEHEQLYLDQINRLNEED